MTCVCIFIKNFYMEDVLVQVLVLQELFQVRQMSDFSMGGLNIKGRRGFCLEDSHKYLVLSTL